MHTIVHVAAGFAVGCAFPGVVRKVRAYFFKEAAAVKADAVKAVVSAETKL